MLTERKIDLTFSCNSTFIRNFERYTLFCDHILLAVPLSDKINQEYADASLSASDIINQKHREENCPTIPLEAFRNMEYILLSPGNNLYDRANQLFQHAGFEPKIKMQLSQLVTAYHLAAQNFAATFISDRIIVSFFIN